jgi:hypothetical protein
MLKSVILGASTLALVASPIAAANAAPTTVAPTNAASTLSLSSAHRAGAPAGKSSKLAGAGIGPISAAIIVAGIAIAAGVLISDKEDDDSDSN